MQSAAASTLDLDVCCYIAVKGPSTAHQCLWARLLGHDTRLLLFVLLVVDVKN